MKAASQHDLGSGRSFTTDGHAGAETGVSPTIASPAVRLRAAREARGLSIADLSRTTKVSASTLAAIENGEVKKLPATIFTRGFVKAYASEVGLDPVETADRYLADLMPETILAKGSEARAFDKDHAPLIREQQAGRFGRVTLAAAVIGLVVYVGAFNWKRATEPADSRSPSQPPSDRTVATGRTSLPTDAAPAALTTQGEVEDDPLHVELTPQGPCWLSAAADGTRVFAELLQAGDSRMIEVRDELVLRVGDPGACTFSINGQAGRSLGPAGAPITVRITKDNYRDFLMS